MFRRTGVDEDVDVRANARGGGRAVSAEATSPRSCRAVRHGPAESSRGRRCGAGGPCHRRLPARTARHAEPTSPDGRSVGSWWRRHYRRLHLHTVKEHSSLPGLPFPESAPRYPSRADVVSYLDTYAARFGIVPRTAEPVRRISLVDERS